jgi:transketolase
MARGGYILREADGGAPRVVLIATGSEVSLACAAQEALAAQGIAARVVSLPCTQRFDAQPAAYRQQILPPELPRVAVEAGHPDLWRKYVGLDGAVIGIECFGESAPATVLYDHFGITVAKIAEAARALPA